MPSYGQIDPNMEITPLKSGLDFVDVRETDAKFYGLVKGEYNRLPENVQGYASERVRFLQTNTSGGRIRFITNSKRLGIRIHVTDSMGLFNMPFSGYAGADCYSGEGNAFRFLGPCCPPLGKRKGEITFQLSGETELITIYLPLYDGVEKLEIGLESSALLETPPPYSRETPIVFYGSSITQGACASRAGNTYCALASRWLDSDFICLGFAGNARGERWMAEYIANLSMSCFVFDYDHNAPDPAHLRKTHRPFLEQILDKQPELPVLLMSRPNPDLSGADRERREIIMENYNWALSRGAKVWFIDGNSLFGKKGKECCTVDTVHPNDLGFYRMAEAVFPVLEEMLKA